jgi:putative spermidine/putrescine transport system ATP-binding protein
MAAMSDRARPLSFRDVAKTYGEFAALRPLSLDVKASEFVTLLGPSGSGKTTLLNIAAGFVSSDGGSLYIGDVDVTHLPPRRRDIGMVFQSYALFPHMTVFDNVAYGLRVRGVNGSEIARRVESVLAMVQLEGLSRRRMPQLSGGQQQRVALARAMVIEPAVLLMDEPLGALDRQMRKHVQLEIRRLHRELGSTTLYVTHDQEEALVMSDRIGIMRNGRIEQIGAPDDLYRRPANAFVAEFLGESNLLKGKVDKLSANEGRVACDDLGIEIVGECGAGLAIGMPAAALIRPENFGFAAPGEEGVPARIVELVYLGELVAIRLALATGQHVWRRCFSGYEMPVEGREVRLTWQRRDVRIVPIIGEPGRNDGNGDATSYVTTARGG